MTPLVVNTDELEKVIAASNKIDIIDLDKSLIYFLFQCFQIREGVKNYLKFALGRYLIQTESELAEYCLMLINDDLIENFKYKDGISSSGGNDGSSAVTVDNINEANDIKSFILLKFDKVNKNTKLLQINRVKLSSTGMDNGDSWENNKNNSSINNNGNNSGESYINSAHKSNFYLNFSINLLMFAFWESIFVGKENSSNIKEK